MSIEVGTRVQFSSPNKSNPANGITGIVDAIDASDVPYHVVFDTPRDGVESKWFEGRFLVELSPLQAGDTIGSVILWTNGMVTVFNQRGEQLPTYSGKLEQVKATIDVAFSGAWESGDWNTQTYARLADEPRWMTDKRIKTMARLAEEEASRAQEKRENR